MKKHILSTFTILFMGFNSFSQCTAPTNTYLPGTYLGYNGTSGVNPLLFRTNSTVKMRVNGDLSTTIGGSPGTNVNGFVGIAPGGYFTAISPWSMLHLEGQGALVTVAGGWRTWMRTGLFMREETDAMYVGMHRTAVNKSDAVICWSDDQTTGTGPDRLRFIFTSAQATGSGTGTNPIFAGALDGYEAMRMEASPNQVNGATTNVVNIGIGPVFGTALTDRPQNRLHINSEESLTNWMQMSIASATGQTDADGMKLGVLGGMAAIRNGNVFLYNQEERHVIFSTGNPTPSGSDPMANTNERLRITSLANPTSTPSSGYGIYNPGGLLNRLTRIAISHDPAAPLTRPMSLLHLGYNVGGGGSSVDGWRPWMDIGTFTGNGTDNMYVGLKNEGVDHTDAIINWGDNLIPGATGPDNLRFIFTSLAGGGLPPATGPNGLEGGRMTPTFVTGVFTGFGGDPTSNPYGPTATSVNPTATLEVNAWNASTSTPGGVSGLRFTNMQAGVSPPIANPGTGVLSVTSNGDVVYVDANAGTGIGNYCSATPNPLVGDDYEIPLGGNNYYFTGDGMTASPTPSNQVGVGYNCGTYIPGKFGVYASNAFGLPVPFSTIAGHFHNFDQEIVGLGTLSYIGVFGESNRPQMNLQAINIGGSFHSENATINIGVNSVVGITNPGVSDRSIAGFFLSNRSGNTTNIGVQCEAGFATLASYALVCTAPFSSGGGSVNDSYAAYLNGDVFQTGTTFPSDSTIKQNIDSIPNVLAILKQLNPKQFEYNHSVHPQLNLENGLQYGLIAQEVESVLPDLVTNNMLPATYDTSGAVVHPAFQIKGLKYQQLIPFLIQGIKEQQSKIDSLQNDNNAQDSINESLQSQISTLAGAIEACCSSGHAMNSNNSNSAITTDVELRDAQSIVLEQNVPNPFAEQTTINYFLPDNVIKAQMLFYNAQGRLIQSVDLNEKGKGQLNVFASDLTNGIYTYSLVVDGKIFETKKMIKN